MDGIQCSSCKEAVSVRISAVLMIVSTVLSIVSGCERDVLVNSYTVKVIPSYNRSYFGNGWRDDDGDGCDTREEILERDAGPAAVDTDGDGCRDDAPVLDLYTGRLVDPPHADADHVVALFDAWNSGAWQWTPAQRRAFAQDQANLRAVGASINRAKGDRGPDTFSPPDRDGWCEYSRIYRATKQRWHLTITPAQNAAVDEMTKTCPGDK
jgi:uncharacterized protein DUF1524